MRRCQVLSLVLFLPLALGGCVSIQSQYERLAQAQDCCRSPAEFAYRPLPADGKLALHVSDASPVHPFAQGRSFFEAVRLNPGATRMRLKIYAAGGGAGVALCPTATFLDAAYATVRSEFLRPRWEAPGVLTSGFYFADYEVPPQARYVVLHSEAQRRGDWLEMPARAQHASLGSIQLLLSSGPTETRYTTCSPAGEVDVQFSS
jgi:hypothetical protein